MITHLQSLGLLLLLGLAGCTGSLNREVSGDSDWNSDMPPSESTTPGESTLPDQLGDLAATTEVVGSEVALFDHEQRYLALISPEDLQVRTLPLDLSPTIYRGLGPTGVIALLDPGAGKLVLVRASDLSHAELDVGPNYDTIAASPDGNYLILYHGEANASSQVLSPQPVLLVEPVPHALNTSAKTPVVLVASPLRLHYHSSSGAVLFESSKGLELVPLNAPTARTFLPFPAGFAAEELSIAPDLSRAIGRDKTDGSIHLFDLGASTRRILPSLMPATSLALLQDLDTIYYVVNGGLRRHDLPGDTSTDLVLPRETGRLLPLPEVGLLIHHDLPGASSTILVHSPATGTVAELALDHPLIDLAASPDGKSLACIHLAQPTAAGGIGPGLLSVIDLESSKIIPIMLDSPVRSYLFSADSRYLFFLLESGSSAHVVDLSTFLVETLADTADVTALGQLPGNGVFLTQRHTLGKITFVTWTDTLELRTLTGFRLNASEEP